jgi:DNA-binding response OmpR family regulator
MPLGDLEAEVYHKVLVVGAESMLLTSLREQLREGDDFRIETAASGFEAGIRAESFHPDCIVIDMAVGRIEAGQIAQNLRKSQDHISTILVALTSEEPGDELYNLGFNDAFKKPFDGALLAERLRRLISQKKADEP